MIRSNYIVFDCETGGLNENENPITQYAAVILDGRTLKEIDRWETYVKPYNDLEITKEALEKTMVNISDINSGLPLKEFVAVAKEFWKQHQVRTKYKDMGRLVPVGHNVTFDIRFINKAMELDGSKENMFETHYENFIDTFALAKMTWGINGDEKLNLGICSERADIILTDAHGAMNDVEATADLLRYYVKNLRNEKIVKKVVEESSRVKGQEFFEFTCVK